MPYAYDYPNAIIKEIIIRSHGRERAVSLAEIGNLKPFRLPATNDKEQELLTSMLLLMDLHNPWLFQIMTHPVVYTR